MNPGEHCDGTNQFQPIGEDHHPAFRQSIGEWPGKRGQQHKGQYEKLLQQWNPFIRAMLGLHQGDGDKQQGVVRQRREELGDQHGGNGSPGNVTQ